MTNKPLVTVELSEYNELLRFKNEIDAERLKLKEEWNTQSLKIEQERYLLNKAKERLPTLFMVKTVQKRHFIDKINIDDLTDDLERYSRERGGLFCQFDIERILSNYMEINKNQELESTIEYSSENKRIEYLINEPIESLNNKVKRLTKTIGNINEMGTHKDRLADAIYRNEMQDLYVFQLKSIIKSISDIAFDTSIWNWLRQMEKIRKLCKIK